MAKCIHCGGPKYGDGLVFFRCKGLGAKREIYEREDGPHDPSSFSVLYLGGANYKKMRRKNIGDAQIDETSGK